MILKRLTMTDFRGFSQVDIELEDIQHGKQYAKILGDFILYTGVDETVTYERGMEHKTGMIVL